PSGANGAPVIRFVSELGSSEASIGGAVTLPNPATLQSLELLLIGDPAAGTITAAYRIDGGAITALPTSATVAALHYGRFFSPQAKAGLLTSHKNGLPTRATFDQFAITSGDAGAVAPAVGQALYRIDVAGAGNYTDTAGQLWKPDTGLFAPASAIAEGAAIQPQEIANTSDDVLYRTYRGNVGNVPVAQRVLTYNLPTRGASVVNLRLHFAERFSGNNAPGKRLFDIEAENKLLRDDFDIFAASGGVNTAVVLPLNNIEVKDGSLTLVFRTVADYASIAAIEVLCQNDCPAPDTTAPAAPTELTATNSSGIVLAWNNSAEPDLVGYNVYRSQAGGSPAKINSELVGVAAYTDGTTAAATAYTYYVTALDSAGNESQPSATASATTPVGPAIRINTGGPAQTVGGVTWTACTGTGSSCSSYVTGGARYAQNPVPSISGATAPANAAIYQTEWTGGQSSGIAVGQTAFTFTVPVANGGYLVRLHFAENNKTASNRRLFDVKLEGSQVLSNFDIFAQAGGINKAIVREFPVTIADGNATIAFITRKENAKISGIEIIPTVINPPTPTPAPSAGAIRINTGGPAQTVGGVTWKACTGTGSSCSSYVTGGARYAQNPVPSISGATAPANAAIYQTEWTGGQVSGIAVGQTAFTFTVPVANGGYLVRLHFADNNKNAPNLRLFDVKLEGSQVLSNFDIFAQAGGINKAIVREFPVTITDGNATIAFITRKENAKISGIEIIPVPPVPATPALIQEGQR
ncbi:MAG: hypothetical protein H7Z42_13370, partial [Roseiflexaceae bacterium]|nr:hypothetical protein [Roseiflexaceae bacterium]